MNAVAPAEIVLRERKKEEEKEQEKEEEEDQYCYLDKRYSVD